MPALLELNGIPVLEGVFRLPRIGVWRAVLALDTADPVSGPAVLRSDSGLEWRGTLRRSGVARAVASAEVVGGAGGLATALPAKTYRNMTVRVALGDLLAEAGERLSPSSASSILDVSLPAYARLAGPASANLSDLLTPAASWRILPDGTFWVGGERWTPFDAITINAWPDRDEAELDFALDLVPGSSVDGRRVSLVQHEVSGMRLRTRVWFE